MVNLFGRSMLKIALGLSLLCPLLLGLSLLGLSLLGLMAFDQPGFAQTGSQQPSAPVPSPNPAPQGGGLKGSEVFAQSRTRYAPLREDQAKFNLGSKHLNAVTSSLQSAGVGFGFGLELTTADALKWVEFRLQAVAMPALHHRFEASAYVPRLGDQRTHAEVWVSYGRRLQDNFFGAGPRYPKTEQTNFDLESRSFNASIYRDLAKNLQAGIYLQQQFSVWISSLYRRL